MDSSFVTLLMRNAHAYRRFNNIKSEDAVGRDLHVRPQVSLKRPPMQNTKTSPVIDQWLEPLIRLQPVTLKRPPRPQPLMRVTDS